MMILETLLKVIGFKNKSIERVRRKEVGCLYSWLLLLLVGSIVGVGNVGIRRREDN